MIGANVCDSCYFWWFENEKKKINWNTENAFKSVHNNMLNIDKRI